MKILTFLNEFLRSNLKNSEILLLVICGEGFITQGLRSRGVSETGFSLGSRDSPACSAPRGRLSLPCPQKLPPDHFRPLFGGLFRMTIRVQLLDCFLTCILGIC